MRFHLGLGSKAKRFFLSSSPKEKTVSGENPVGEFGFKGNPAVDSGFRYSGFGSKDEIFFDSKAWLDSDCEDDFFSVNGDLTPSRGSTPKHYFSTPGTPQANKSLHLPTFPDPKSEPSPTAGKKKLFDLLQETVQDEKNKQNAETNGKANGYKLSNNQPSRSFESSPYNSGTNSVWSSEVTPSRDSSFRKERTRRPKSCCFPGLVPGCGLIDRRKQK
ncbi:uncharacterized protein At3g27210-like, partial [Asparagus officinalis]